MPRIKLSPQDRFWPKVEKTATCWLWAAAKLPSGYGIFTIERVNQYAHRVAWEWLRGPIPFGLDIDHLCRVRNCVNPDHLEPVTRRVNLLRGKTIVSAQAQRTHCPNGHEYTEENTVKWNRHRSCRICTNQRLQKYTYAWKKEQGYFARPSMVVETSS